METCNVDLEPMKVRGNPELFFFKLSQPTEFIRYEMILQIHSSTVCSSDVPNLV